VTDRSHARRRRSSFAARFIASVSRLFVSATSSPRRDRRRHDARDVRPHDDTTRRAPFIFVTLTRSSRRPASRTRSTRPTNFPLDALASPRLVAVDRHLIRTLTRVTMRTATPSLAHTRVSSFTTDARGSSRRSTSRGVAIVARFAVGDAVRVTADVRAYHVPKSKGQGVDLKGMVGVVESRADSHQGTTTSATLPCKVALPVPNGDGKTFIAHLGEDELERA